MELPSTRSPVWVERLRIRSYDADATRRAASPSLCRYFFEAAWNHAEALGVGYAHLRRQGKFWVLARLLCEVPQYPEWGEWATLRTWPRGIKSVFALREFELLAETGTRLAAGSSAWLVVDSVSKRPLRLHQLLPGLTGMEGDAALGRDPAKLPENETWDHESSITACYTDIDVNQHVTSSRYLGWMLDAYPAAFHLQHSLRVLEVNYLNETIQGEKLIVKTRQNDSSIYCHSLVKSDGREVCRARLEWKPWNGENTP
jgi:acyl-ACP thioesterase